MSAHPGSHLGCRGLRGVWDSACMKYLCIQGLAPKCAYRNTFQVGLGIPLGYHGLREVSGIGVQV